MLKLIAEILKLLRDVLILYRDILALRKKTIKEAADADVQKHNAAVVGGDIDAVNVDWSDLFSSAKTAIGGNGGGQSNNADR